MSIAHDDETRGLAQGRLDGLTEAARLCDDMAARCADGLTTSEAYADMAARIREHIETKGTT